MHQEPALPLTPRSLTPAESEGESDPELNYDAPATAAPEDAFFKDFSKNRLSSSIRHLGVILNSKRKAALEPIRGAATAWIDQDQSGNYDPSTQRIRPPVRRTKRVKLEGDDENGTRNSLRTYRRAGYSLTISFFFTKKKALSYLRSITPSSENSEGSNADDELSDTLYSDDESVSGSRKTRRKVKASKRLGAVVNREDGLSLKDLTEGHPQRRGCKACFHLGNDDCSLIEEAFEYPCVACDDADMECELIIPPKLKKSCEGCKRKRIPCSYKADGGKDVDTCNACEYDDEACCAAPLKESAYTKRFTNISLPATDPIVGRMFIACCQCRGAGLRCSLKRDQPGPCKICRENGDKCTFTLESNSNAIAQFSRAQPPQKSKKSKKVPKKHRRAKRAPILPVSVQHATDSLATPERSWEILGEEAERKFKKSSWGKEKGERYVSIPLLPTLIPAGNLHKIIKTCFAHPIKFNYIPDPLGAHPCSWCTFPFFGLWGHGEVTVEVIPWGGSVGNEEVAGGHSSKHGHESSKMCVACTFSRVRTMTCQGHRVRRIPGFNIDAGKPESLEASFKALAMGDKEGGELAVRTKWCSVCVAVAEHKCCTSQHYSDSAEPLANGNVLEGCGLFLCATCNDTFERIEKSKGNSPNVVVLDSLVKVRGDELWKHGRGKNGDGGGDDADRVRADAVFLTSKGELMERMAQGMDLGGGEMEMEVDEVGDGGKEREFEAGLGQALMLVDEKKKKSGKEKGKQNGVRFEGELVINGKGNGKPKVDRKGKGKAILGVEYEETKNGYRAKRRLTEAEEEDMRAWEELWE